MKNSGILISLLKAYCWGVPLQEKEEIGKLLSSGLEKVESHKTKWEWELSKGKQMFCWVEQVQIG